MKITKRQLRRIIKEEYRRAINEADIRITAGSSDYYETDGMTEYNFDVELNGAQQSVSFEMGGFPADAEDVASTLARELELDDEDAVLVTDLTTQVETVL